MGLSKFFQSLTNSAVRRELYEFTRGESKFYYTSGDKPVQDGETIYEAITLTRSSIDSSSDLEKNSIDIIFALNSEFAQDCLRSALEENILVKVSKLQFGTISTLWQGRVTAVKPEGVEITLKCETDYTSLGRAGARYKYQRTCCHDLYGKGCKLDKLLWGIQTTVKSVDKLNVQLRNLSVDDNYFRLGMLQSNAGVNVAIESSTGQSVTLIRRLDTLSSQITTDVALSEYNIAKIELEQAIANRDALDPLSPTYEQDFQNAKNIVEQKQVVFDLAAQSVFFVTVYPGCMKSLTACHRFGNTNNFLGFPYMPEDNPTTTRIV
ncbi:DUF2163 domain-containing protein [Acinetobacter wuhouensis]|uniref:baseplate hub domain-containing protein n=1 Tax=Acinetobacter wuhouensis TaxID=1879050 RepID=UPI00083A7A50|nr:DUF2163 domain-containing protein [Acinetobacter wuhouensis]AXQ21836.1 DUF2163 domain-containing protein [Acinetobacter wuhouensis]AXQ22427.1 DUF2163 domain-containing protein [Acinetobacter wuhouensis]